MKRVIAIAVVGVLLLGISAAWAEALDLTTNVGKGGEDTVQRRMARYTVILGQQRACTLSGVDADGNSAFSSYQGCVDIATACASAKFGWVLCDGVTTPSSGYTSIFSTLGADASEDYLGWRFKQAVTVESLCFANLVATNGGTFAASPTVEVLNDEGTWQAISVTGLESYDPSFPFFEKTVREYTVTATESTGYVWGVRLIGAAAASPYEGDLTGWVACTELQVSGESSLSAMDLDLSVNLAAGQAGFMRDIAPPDRLVRLTDGTFYDVCGTWSVGDTEDTEYVGVTFDESQANVTAVGLCMRNQTTQDTGYLSPDTISIEYTTDDGATWTPVTGLDLGLYDNDLMTEFQTMIAEFDLYRHTTLMTFDPIRASIDGVRVVGDAPNGTADDPTGFLAVFEIEVFGSVSVPEPSMLALLLGLPLWLLVRRQR